MTVSLRIGLEQLTSTLEGEQITVDILSEMSHEDLRAVGVAAYGHRHRLLKAARHAVQAQSGLSHSVLYFIDTSMHSCIFTGARTYIRTLSIKTSIHTHGLRYNEKN